MATYKNGILTKKTITETCRTLFYEKGYADTTYQDICKKATVNPRTITRHCDSKKNIGIEIYSDFLIDIKEKTKKYLIDTCGEYNLRIGTIIERIIFLDLIETNESYRRFYYDLCVDGLFLDSFADKLNYFFKLHSDEYNLGLSQTDIELFGVATTSISFGVHKKWLENFFDNLSKDGCLNFEIKLMFSFMHIPEVTVDDLLEKSYVLYRKMKILTIEPFMISIQ
ncbi:TetR family transcriptional regulator [Acetobacterium fimetarium]|uniref:TetR family transcriptional regulator n=1 Tax=Acetobacterium fimetarium TaxID=52691 RepID=A0ABR6WS01_9FIRM|nr:TetR/AcrR family transcriptional regulator [Acetobacterium fimetarium]MBC3803377.1 TetR family transcriptional regulator [Acetobacterium fimetarium]